MGVRHADRTLLLSTAGQYLIGRDDGSTFVTGDVEYAYLEAAGFLKEPWKGFPKRYQLDTYGPMRYPVLSGATIADGLDINQAQLITDLLLYTITPEQYRLGAETVWAGFVPKGALGPEEPALWITQE